MEIFGGSTNIKKEVATESVYQSTFLPLFSNAETQIKKLIIYYFWNLKSKNELRLRIAKIIEQLDKNIPQNVINRESYINGINLKAKKMIEKYYERALITFYSISQIIIKNSASLPRWQIPKIDTPKELTESIIKNKIPYRMWEQAKGIPQVQNYPNEIKKFLNGISGTTITASEDGKKPISLWQKAELDIRHKKQIEQYQTLLDKGVEYAWFSSHPDCSKRCEKWQGKLVSLTERSTMSGFRVKKLDNEWVYSFLDITEQVDEYGYTNNIFVGFNCRHKLIPYEKGKLPPKEYDEKDIKKQRDIETHIRALEREIRNLKQQYNAYRVANFVKEAQKLKNIIKQKIAFYKDFCNRNGYAWEEYRI